MVEGTQRRLAAIVSADVVGYSRLMGVDETGTLAELNAHRSELIDPLVQKHGGRIVKATGDGLLLEFPSVVTAVECSIAIQDGMMERNANLTDDVAMRFRVGVHLGDIIVEGDDIFGDGVNVAARLEGLSEPNGLALSDDAYRQVRDRLDIDWQDGGEHEVKNIARPVYVWRWSKQETLDAAAVSGTLPLPDKPSIAVLPFDNMSGDAEQEYFAEGITEDIITELSKLRWFFVTARNSTFAYKGRSIDIKQLAAELGVRYVLEGSVRRSANRLRITAQLIDASTGNHIWAERYDRQLDDIFELQDEITQTIVATIEPELGMAERELAIRKPRETVDAWTSFQQGLWHHYRFTKEENAEAQKLFRKSIKADPNFSRAQGALAHAIYWDVLFGFTDSPEEALEDAKTISQNAISSDDKEPFAHFAYGRILTLTKDHENAIAELERAIELNPNFAHAFNGLAMALAMSGRPDEAVQKVEIAIRLNPHDPSIWTYMSLRSLALIMLKRHDEALSWATKATRQRSPGWLAYAILASALGHLSKIDDARKAGRDALTLKPDFTLSFIKQTFPFKKPDHLEVFLEGLRLADLPE
jgi:adenylate cyclase